MGTVLGSTHGNLVHGHITRQEVGTLVNATRGLLNNHVAALKRMADEHGT